MSRSLDMDGAHTCAIAQAQGNESLLLQEVHSYHVGGHVNVWVCGYCFRSTPGTIDATAFTCICGERLP